MVEPRFIILENVSASLLTGWTSFSESWPRQGLMQSGHTSKCCGSLPSKRSMVACYYSTTSDHLDRTYHYPACVGKTRGEKLGWAIGKYLGHNDGLTGKIGVNRSRPTGDHMYLNPAFLEEMMGYQSGGPSKSFRQLCSSEVAAIPLARVLELATPINGDDGRLALGNAADGKQLMFLHGKSRNSHSANIRLRVGTRPDVRLFRNQVSQLLIPGLVDRCRPRKGVG